MSHDAYRAINVPDLDAALAPGADVDTPPPLHPLFAGIRELLKAHGHPTNVGVRLLVGDGYRLEVALDTEAMGTKVLIRPELGREASTELVIERLLLELDAELSGKDDPVAGADSPLTARTGERLLDEAGYGAMRSTVLGIARALGALELELFDALIATAERSIGPGLEQAVADGTVPLDRLGDARDALALELRLFRLARSFRAGIAGVQSEVREHLAKAEEEAGAPPRVEVIRHNAGQNGGGT